MNVGTPGPAAPAATRASLIGASRFRVSTPALERTTADKTSVTASPRRTSSTATPLNTRARGRWTSTARASIDALWRYTAWMAAQHTMGIMTAAANAAMTDSWVVNHPAPRSTEVVDAMSPPTPSSNQRAPSATQ